MSAPFGQSVPSLIGLVGVALDVDDLAALHVDELAAADGAVRADARDGDGAADSGPLLMEFGLKGWRGASRLESNARAVLAG